MGNAERIYEIAKSLSEEKQAEVIDFIELLKQKEDRLDDELIEKVLSENAEALKELAK